ncbi:hypothetical protein [Flavobacterium sp.]|uniref:hypothetical protein n=1 Tax=Flavobacterium sp. TaxID=239 RepID=UPI003A8F8F87
MKNWIVQGFVWALIMCLLLDVVFPLMSEETLKPLRIIIGFVVWCIFGLGFSYYNHRKNKGPKKQIDG